MIEEITAKNLKNRNFTFKLGPKTLIIGDNGTGKSAILSAISLLRMGYVLGCGKQPVATMDALATDKKMIVEGSVNGLHVCRRFMRTKAGAKQDFAVGNRKATTEKFTGAINGAPTLIDLSVFTSLSEKKQIEYLIDLYGENDDLMKVDGEIAVKEERLSEKRAKLREKEATVKETAKSIAEIELPSGTLAEIQKQIQNTLDEYDRVNQELSDARAQSKKSPDTHPSPPDQGKVGGQTEADQSGPPDTSTTPKNNITNQQSSPGTAPQPINNDAAIAAIQKIMAVMENSCGTCAAKITAKMEIKKLRNPEKF